jgi:uncharacterized membrane protein
LYFYINQKSMKPFFVLIITFVVSFVMIRLVTGTADPFLAGNIAMSAMLLFTAIGHFAFVKGMELMMPPFIPFKAAMVYLTGLIEVMAAAGLLIPSLQLLTSYLLILFFILILPVNIYAASKNVDYQKGSHEGPGLSYLWFRIPFQLFLIAWVYLCNIFHAALLNNL